MAAIFDGRGDDVSCENLDRLAAVRSVVTPTKITPTARAERSMRSAHRAKLRAARSYSLPAGIAAEPCEGLLGSL